MSIRDIRDRARASLHDRMSVPATYYAPAAAWNAGVPCTIRVHRRTKSFGDMTGFSLPTERIEAVPEVVCLRTEVLPEHGGHFILAPDEGYHVEVVLPVDGITVTAQVSVMRSAEIVDLTTPPPPPPPPPEPDPEL